MAQRSVSISYGLLHGVFAFVASISGHLPLPVDKGGGGRSIGSNTCISRPRAPHITFRLALIGTSSGFLPTHSAHDKRCKKGHFGGGGGGGTTAPEGCQQHQWDARRLSATPGGMPEGCQQHQVGCPKVVSNTRWDARRLSATPGGMPEGCQQHQVGCPKVVSNTRWDARRLSATPGGMPEGCQQHQVGCVPEQWMTHLVCRTHFKCGKGRT